MEISEIIADVLLYIFALPLMAFQSLELIKAFIQFAADIAQYFQK